MRIRLGELRRLIRETLLLEYTVSPDATLYHRSPQRFKVGDVLTAQVDPATGRHWQQKKQYEREMEDVRKRDFPNLPSRFNCIFASFHPRSRFIGKGFLYAVKPIGKMHVTDSKLIDQIGRNSWKDNDYGYDTSLIEDYWKGVEPRRGNILDMEILMDQAQVTEVLDEPKRLGRGVMLKFGANAPTVKGTVSLNEMKAKGDTPAYEYVYASDGNTQVEAQKAMSALEVDGVQVGSPSGTGWSKKLPVSIGPGFEGIVCSYRGEEPKSFKDRDRSPSVPSITLSPGSSIGKDGIFINLDDRGAQELIKAFRSGRIERK